METRAGSTSELNRVVSSAAKWSLLNESIAKLILPVTQLILARMLAPSEFGVLATAVMVQSFAQMLADAGFQKYLIQREFADEAALCRAASVAFWASMTVATTLLAGIAAFRDPLATAIGNPGLGGAIAVASFSLPLTVFTANQDALFRRAFQYKKLLPRRVIVALVPLMVSVPLALADAGYWSLIIGVLAADAANAVMMTIISPWKPSFTFSLQVLREMFSFSSWSLLEAISIWATTWSGTFIVSRMLTTRELGLYRQPILVVNSLFALVTAATTPVLFAALSRLQSQPDEYRHFFLRFQFNVAAILFPVGVGAFFFRDFFTDLLFGAQWSRASLMFGLRALTTCIMIVFAHYSSEIFRSLGRPRVSFVSQCLYMAVMIPAVYVAAGHGFRTLVIVSALIRLVQVIIAQTLVYLVAGHGLLRVIRNVSQPMIASALMGAVAAGASACADDRIPWSIAGILVCASIYVAICAFLPGTRPLCLALLTAPRRRRA